MTQRSITLEEILEDAPAAIQEVHAGSDRAAAITAAAMLDDMLHGILERSFVEAPRKAKELLENHLDSFASRITACYCLGLISNDEHRDLHMLRSIRNAFAHSRKSVSFDSPAVRDKCHDFHLAKRFWDLAKLDPDTTKLWFISEWMLLANALSHRLKRTRRRSIPRPISMRREILFR